MVLAVNKKVLILAPSNAAVANVALKLISTSRFGAHNVVVYGNNCDETISFLNPSLRYERYTLFLRKYNKLENEEEKAVQRQRFARWLWLENAETASLKDLESLCDDPDGRKSVGNADVVLCTLNTAGSKPLRSAAKKKFELIILDEGSQCSEAEFYIATTFPGVQRIVVVGDPRQLPATVLCMHCEDAGYGESFLSHIFAFQPKKVHLLDTQYRMDPPLLEFANETFYGNRIKSDISVMNRRPHVEQNFRFITTSEYGDDAEEKRGPSWCDESWCNEYEAGVIKSLIKSDKDIRNIQSELEGNARIIVITPYKAQVAKLRQVLKKIQGVRNADISTVDSFQGQEGDIVLFSSVRTKSVGFCDNANRLCVAMTRAKRVMRVVGDLDFCE